VNEDVFNDVPRISGKTDLRIPDVPPIPRELKERSCGAFSWMEIRPDHRGLAEAASKLSGDAIKQLVLQRTSNCRRRRRPK